MNAATGAPQPAAGHASSFSAQEEVSERQVDLSQTTAAELGMPWTYAMIKFVLREGTNAISLCK